MNSANENLRIIRNQKATITKAYEEAKEKLEKQDEILRIIKERN